MKLVSNISVTPVTVITNSTLSEFYEISRGDAFLSRNLVLDIGIGYIARAMSGIYELMPVSPNYVAVGRSVLPGGASPAANDTSIEEMSDPDPYFFRISSKELITLADQKYPNAVLFTTYIVGVPEMFEHFGELGDTIKIGELGLFMGAPYDPTTLNTSDIEPSKFTIFARQNILETRGSALSIPKSTEEGVYSGYLHKWLVAMFPNFEDVPLDQISGQLGG